MDVNQTAEMEEYEEKQKALSGVAIPILQKLADARGRPNKVATNGPAGEPVEID